MSTPEANVGIIGSHVGGSLSPVMHNAAYQEMGIALHYGTFEVSAIEDDLARQNHLALRLGELADAGVIGLSITMPFKEDVLETDRIGHESSDVSSIGAANTLSSPAREGDQTLWMAENTDWRGANEALSEVGTEIAGKHALVIGAGGTARAVLYGLAKQGVRRVTVANRTFARAVHLANDLEDNFQETSFIPADLRDFNSYATQERIKELDIVFNTTNIGQVGTKAEGEMPLYEDLIANLKPGTTIVDAVYMPLETPLLAHARERQDLVLVNGTRMLLHQAVEQVRIFTGERDVPIEVMDRALQNEITARTSK